MELEEMKAGWDALSNRIARNEILNQRIIKEMVSNRTRSAYSRLFRFDLMTIIITVIIGILLPFFKMNTIMTMSSFVVFGCFLIIMMVMQVYQFSFLLRFSIESKGLYELSWLTLKYKLWMKRIYIISFILSFLVVIAFFLLQGDQLYHDWWRYYVIIFAFVIAIPLVYIQLRFYNRNIATIEKGLEELKDFEE